mmetsp:Transcript_23113/g.34469  ORF Transcript_23113/g.34469 Transcript_23113/m.34469 type:complete len:317 (-) Transcript_23113:492-1442(-)
MQQHELKHAPPPAHAVLLVTAISGVCIHFLPSLEEIDQVATIDVFTKPVFPDGVLSSPETMGWIRLFFCFIIYFTTIRFMFIGAEPTPMYLPGSKLKSRTIKIRGIRTQWWFTGWCWNILGVYFFCSGLISLLVSNGQEELVKQNPWLLRVTFLVFEIAAPNAFLVSTIVRYALWENNLKKGGPSRTLSFQKFTSLMEHNGNIAMVLFEVCILGGTPVLPSHIAVAPLFGVLYVLFTWAVSNQWCPEKRPYLPYFLLDTTLGAKTTFMLACLVVVLVVFYFFFSLIEIILERIDGGPISHAISMMILLSMVCRFRD